MTGKHGHNYYKGTRTGNVGQRTRRGEFRVDYSKVRTYVVPKQLADTKVRDYLYVYIRADVCAFQVDAVCGSSKTSAGE